MSKYAVFFDDSGGRLKRVQNFRYDSTSNSFQFFDSTGTHFFAIKANDSATSNYTYTLPAAPVNGAFLRVDTTGGSPVLSWEFSSNTRNEFNFDVTSPSGQITFETEISLNGKFVKVLTNGVLQREGALHDYLISGTQVVFNSAVPKNGWVRIVVETGALPTNYDTVGPISGSWDLGITLSGRFVEVFVNGVMQREGVSYDWYTSGTEIIFVNSIPANAWVRAVVS
jgi:hypothetical protein